MIFFSSIIWLGVHIRGTGVPFSIFKFSSALVYRGKMDAGPGMVLCVSGCETTGISGRLVEAEALPLGTTAYHGRALYMTVLLSPWTLS